MTKNKFILHNGVKMIEGWPEQIEDSQKICKYNVDGEDVDRIPFGNETYMKNEYLTACPDCGVTLGQFHVAFVCDTEECPVCHTSLL
ncbi:MAG: hypothetical protein JJU29_07435 [Verrucomicrobia bacterium]|nr:hypothetical protein [Verrucomicrobiota bacterium]